jgi:biotin-[acetyl-CoA-carboxylase] ligase BirA-like protein
MLPTRLQGWQESEMMLNRGKENISGWVSRIDTFLTSVDDCCVNRVVAVETTPSTMDAAKNLAQRECGLLLVASHQTKGRGQRGRQWIDEPGKTLPCTFVINSKGESPTLISSIVACAVHQTLVSQAPASSEVMIKWPNDIVVAGLGDHRKLAGILIEQHSDLSFIGIGINCLQSASDWPSELEGNAVSLSELGSQVSRVDLLCKLIENLSYWLAMPNPAEVRSYFATNNSVIGSVRTLKWNNNCFQGVITELDPLESIVVETPQGTFTLPIAQTRLIGSDEEPCDCR